MQTIQKGISDILTTRFINTKSIQKYSCLNIENIKSFTEVNEGVSDLIKIIEEKQILIKKDNNSIIIREHFFPSLDKNKILNQYEDIKKVVGGTFKNEKNTEIYKKIFRTGLYYDVSILLKIYLLIFFTNVESERNLSIVKLIASSSRNSISLPTIHKLTFIFRNEIELSLVDYDRS